MGRRLPGISGRRFSVEAEGEAMLHSVRLAAGPAESGGSGPVAAPLLPARALTRNQQAAHAAAGAS